MSSSLDTAVCCDKCGRSIKNIFQWESKIYGSECIRKVIRVDLSRNPLKLHMVEKAIGDAVRRKEDLNIDNRRW